jgi:biotin carboxyl carrier protein
MPLYRVKIDGKEYSVEILDLTAQPAVVEVDGRRVEVWKPEDRVLRGVPVGTPLQTRDVPAGATIPAAARVEQPIIRGASEVRAPMPGTVVDVQVGAGDRVETGQDLCVLDAMKMNNRIRASREGTIGEVLVTTGQQVQHGDLLLTYADETP